MKREMYCPKCGGEYEEGVKFCTKCGTPLEEKKETEKKETSTKKKRSAQLFGSSLCFFYQDVQRYFASFISVPARGFYG